MKYFLFFYLLPLSLLAEAVDFTKCNNWLKEKSPVSFNSKGELVENKTNDSLFSLEEKKQGYLKMRAKKIEGGSYPISMEAIQRGGPLGQKNHIYTRIEHRGEIMLLDGKRHLSKSSFSFSVSPTGQCIVKKGTSTELGKREVVFDTKACREIVEFAKKNKSLFNRCSKKVAIFTKDITERYNLNPTSFLGGGRGFGFGYSQNSKISEAFLNLSGNGQLPLGKYLVQCGNVETMLEDDVWVKKSFRKETGRDGVR